MSKEILSLFGIEILRFNWIDVHENGEQYEDVEFQIDSLKQYDGRIVYVSSDWKITIYDPEGIVKELEFSLMENVEFRTKLYEKYPALI